MGFCYFLCRCRFEGQSVKKRVYLPTCYIENGNTVWCECNVLPTHFFFPSTFDRALSVSVSLGYARDRRGTICVCVQSTCGVAFCSNRILYDQCVTVIHRCTPYPFCTIFFFRKNTLKYVKHTITQQ